jgi:REP element-mobilizing transposase RayT
MINLIDTDHNFDIIELMPKVFVYRNAMPDIKNLYSIMKESEESGEGKYFLKNWDAWSHFGTYSQHKSDNEDAEKGDRYDKERYFVDTVNTTYSKVISHYVKNNEIDLPESARFSGCSFSKYEPNIDHMSNNMTMQYHTDFIMSQKDMPGEKFLITCTMYINDDYDGGNIEFFVNGKTYDYKPEAGDILVFPSIAPYYHGVKTIKNGRKFFVRNFVMYEYEGSEEWLAKQRQYGAYRWGKMEIDRIEEEDPKNMIYLEDGERVSYEEVERRYSN